MAAHASGPRDAKRRLRTSRWSRSSTRPSRTTAMPATREGRSRSRLTTDAPDAGGVAALAVGDGAAAVEVIVGTVVRDVEDADADVAVDDQPSHARGRLPVVAPVDVEAAGPVAEHVDLPGADVRPARHAHVARHGERDRARADLEVDGAVAGRQLRVAQVEDEVADAELVRAAD